MIDNYRLDIDKLFFNYKQSYVESIKRREYVSPYDDPFDKVIREGLTKVAKEKLTSVNPLSYYGLISEKHIYPTELIKKFSKISLVTSCMNRNEFLKKSLMDSWLRFPFKEIIVIDWSSTDDLSLDLRFDTNYIKYQSKYEEFVKKFNINIIKVIGEKYYNHSKVRNYKVRKSTGEWILCIDADVMLTHDFLDTIQLIDDKVYYMNNAKKSDRGLFGTALFKREMYEKVGGFDEDIKYWGSEDSHFYNKANALGYTAHDIRTSTLYHQPHSDKMRSENTPFNSIYESLTENNYIIAKKTAY